MNTTSLFVELVVIGVGALAWVALLVLSVFGYDWVPLDPLLAAAATVPLLSVVYVLGIVSDRVADLLFDLVWTRTLRGHQFADIQTHYTARRDILTKSERLSELLEYGRSRLRICRGWVLNAALILLSFNLFVFVRLREWRGAPRLSIVASVLLLALAAGCWYSWWSLSAAEYRKVKSQSRYLAGTGGQGAAEQRGAHES